MHTLPPMHSPHPPGTEEGVGGIKSLGECIKPAHVGLYAPSQLHVVSFYPFPAWNLVLRHTALCHNLCPPVGTRPDLQWYFVHICRSESLPGAASTFCEILFSTLVLTVLNPVVWTLIMVSHDCMMTIRWWYGRAFRTAASHARCPLPQDIPP